MIRIKNILDAEKITDRFEAVIFDLDDTLYSEKEYVRSGFRAIAKEYPQIEHMFEKLWKAFLDGKRAIDCVLEQESLLKERDNCLRVYRYHVPDIHLFDGAECMIQRLRRTKKIGIITDGRPEGQKAKISALGLDKLVDRVIITDELGGIVFRKPNPEAFKIIKNEFGCDYSKICYIGDNDKKDGLAPEQLGMVFIYFDNKDGLYAQ